MRLKCVVPFCRRTRGERKGQPPLTATTQWICGDHWPMIPQRARRAYGRHVRQWRRFSPDAPDPAGRRLWAWLKRKAIERALGIRS